MPATSPMPSTDPLPDLAPPHADPPADRVGDDSVDLRDSTDPQRLIPGDPQGLRAAARGLVDNAGLHEAIAGRHRRLRDGGWTGDAADAFHTHTQRQTTRHLTTGDGVTEAAAALNELADGIDRARTRAGRAATLYANSDPDQRGDRRADPALREEARDLLDGARAELDDLHARVRVRLAAAHAQLPDPRRLLRDPEPDSPVTPARLPAPFAGNNPATTATARGFSTGLSTDLSTAAAVGPAVATTPHITADSVSGADPAAMAGPSIERRAGRRVVVRRGDTLSGIAARYLGDPGRWPEILDHNPAIAHPWQIQPGQALTLPDTTEPADRGDPPHHPDPSSRSHTDPTTHDGGDGAGSGHPPAPSTPPVDPIPDPHTDGRGHQDGVPADGDRHDGDPGGVGLEGGLLIGGGLAAAVSAAYLLRRRRHAHTHRPDSTDRDHPADPHPPRRPAPGVDGPPDDIAASIRAALDPPTSPGHAHPGGAPGHPATTSRPAPTPTGAGWAGQLSVAPVVRQLHYAYHRRARPDGLAELTGTAAVAPPAPPWLLPADGPDPARRARPRLLVPFGLTPGGATVPVDLAGTPALVLADHTPNHTPPDEGTATAVAAGSVTRSADRADDVARALLLTIAAGMRTLTGAPLGHVVITIADLRHLLGITTPGPQTVDLPGTLRVVEDLDAALDDLEVALAHRAPAPGPQDPVEAPVVLIATAPRPGTPTARMQRLLETGHPHRVCAILLGDWPTPTRVTVGADATAAEISGPLPADLSGARLFTVPRHDALDLLTTLARPSDPAQPLDPSTRAVESAAQTFAETAAETAVGPGVERAGDDSAENAAHDPATPAAAAASDATAADGAGRDPAAGGDSTGAADGAVGVQDAPAAGPVLSLRIFGRLSLRYDPAGIADTAAGGATGTGSGRVSGGERPGQELAGQLSERRRELLIYLALHPDGVRRDLLIEHLWPDAGIDRPTAPLNAALTRLRASLTQLTGRPMNEVIRTDGDGHYRLNPDLVTVDYHRYTTALAARRAARTAEDRAAADRALLGEYRGELAPALHPAWIEASRRHATDAALTAATDIARHLTTTGEPDQAAAVLDYAITVVDPFNEGLYAQLIRLHQHQGRADAARRTFAALVAELAKLDATPSRDTLALMGGAA